MSTSELYTHGSLFPAAVCQVRSRFPATLVHSRREDQADYNESTSACHVARRALHDCSVWAYYMVLCSSNTSGYFSILRHPSGHTLHHFSRAQIIEISPVGHS